MSRTVLLRAALGLSLASLATAADAQDRPFAPQMSCSAVAGLVARSGAIVIGTGPYTYDRVVTGQRYCPIEEITTPAWTATTDNPQCFVGYRCKDRFNEGAGDRD